MDISEYLPMFLAEGREHLQDLNLAVVRIEEQPDDRETVDQIFRIAHSFKGMSATMGFEGIAALTHRMEDVLDLLRQRSGGLSQDAVNVLLECLDALEAAVRSIEENGAETIDPTALLERLGGLIRADVAGPAPAPADAMTPAVLAALAEGRRVVQVIVRLADGVAMPAVRAFMALAALSDHGEVLGSVPTEEDVDGFAGATVEAWLATEHEDEAIAAAALGVADVASAEVREADAPPVEPELAAVEAIVQAAGAAVDAPAAKSAPKGAKGAASVRVDAERLDQLMHLMGELVVHRTSLESIAAGSEIPGLASAIQDVTRSSQALQAMVMQVRMIPVEAVFLRFPRLIRDLSTKLGKQVDLQLVGQDTELDRTVVDALGDPIVHLVRNSLDHGLEAAEDRVAAGKAPVGVLEISARHAGSNVIITVRDDGRGIDPARVAAIAVKRGMITVDAVDSIDSQRAIELLFAPGFSTAEVTSDLSGRGVGMDAVRTMVRELGGEVWMTSELGAGTTAAIRLPLTLAIMPALVVEMGGAAYAIPIDRVERILWLADQNVRSMAGRKMLLLDDGTLPLCDGARAFGHETPDQPAHAVIVRGGDRRVAIGVSALVGQRELVTRPLPAELGERGGAGLASGGAVLADGDITFIVDCDALAATLGGDAPPQRERSHLVTPLYSDLQLDALREVANIGSGTAGTALSGMLGKSVDLSVPKVLALPLAEAVEAIGAPDSAVTAVVIPIFGDMDAVVVLLFAPEAADTLCALLGVEAASEVGQSALCEIGNILGTTYVGSIEAMTGLHLEPRPPQTIADMLGAVVSSVLLFVSGAGDVALVMDSALEVEGEACSLSFLLVPSGEGVTELLARLGMGE